MQLTSPEFFLFTLVVLLIYWPLPAGWRKYWLFAACLFFLGTWDWLFAVCLLSVGTVNYWLAQVLDRLPGRRLAILWLGISMNILTLVFFKYNHFFLPILIGKFNELSSSSVGAITVLLPIGLSFITLQMISYLVDVYNRQVAPERNWFKFNLYVLYFPKLLSGPLERARAFLPRLDHVKALTGQSIASAFGLIGIGLLRKVIFANVLNALLPADVFSDPLKYPAQLLVIWLVAYAFFLYNDFAGYSSLARGISWLFGIDLAQNFNTPYLASNFSEFWGRWHISLSAWLRDYIYFPVSRFLRTKIPDAHHKIHLILPPLVTMLASGLWHGLSWNLMLWGVLHGLYQAAERWLNLSSPKSLPGQAQSRWKHNLSVLLVFCLVTLAWIPFRMDLVTARRYLAGIVLPSHWLMPDFFWLQLILNGRERIQDFSALYMPDPRIFLVLIPSLWLDEIQSRAKDELFFLKWPRWRLAAACALILLLVFLLSFTDLAAPFVYQGF